MVFLPAVTLLEKKTRETLENDGCDECESRACLCMVMYDEMMMVACGGHAC